MTKTRSFARSLFLGHVAEDLVTPWWRLPPEEETRVSRLCRDFSEWAGRHYDPHRVEEERWVGDGTVQALGEMGLLGLYAAPEHGGQGLSETGYGAVMRAVARVDLALAFFVGVHQAIGYQGIHLFGTEEQKQRYLPDLVSGRALAAFALTEQEAGSDARSLASLARLQPDGSYILDGDKRYVGNASHADVITTFARTDTGQQVALLVDTGTAGVEPGKRYDTMGLCGNDLRPVSFRDVRVPRENVLGTEGDGFLIATEVLHHGRVSLGSTSAGGADELLRRAVTHTRSRKQFGRRLAGFELVRQKVAWMTVELYGLESLGDMTAALVDRGMDDFALEAAMLKVRGSELLWRIADHACQLAGGEGYLRGGPYEKALRDIRVLTVVEGANDVLRAYVALQGLKAPAEELQEMRDVRHPRTAVTAAAGFVADRARLAVRPDHLTGTANDLADVSQPVGRQARELRSAVDSLLRRHGQGVRDRQAHQERLTGAATDLAAQVATVARASASGDEDQHLLAEVFCRRASERATRLLHGIEDNDDEAMGHVADLAYGSEEPAAGA